MQQTDQHLYPANLANYFSRFQSTTSKLTQDAPVNSKEGKVLHPDLLNQNLVKAQYAVRGELYLRATELQKEGVDITFTNVGNPQALGQKPNTFNRQVMSLVVAPFLMDHPKVLDLFPRDAVDRAKVVLGNLKPGVGAYSDSRGAPGIRQEIADFIEARDGFPTNPEHIFLTDGASVGVRMVLNALIRDSRDGIMVPIPQYPLYSASIQLYGGSLVPYYLNESKGWSMDLDHLKKSLDTARQQGLCVRALVFINPGNPTGQCLTADNLKDLIKFAYQEKIVLMADEVYQENIYQDDKPFVSCRKVMHEMGAPYDSEQELISYHTISKGTLGECGLRGGYYEMTNIHQQTVEELYKIASINLCPNTLGQVGMSLMCNPIKPGQESFAKYKEERQQTLESLRRRAHIMTDGFNSLEDVTCNFTEGAMYSFPRIRLPPKAMEAAAKEGKSPDVFYCLKLLESTGISTVPGSGFGQEEGTLHLRTTILPPEDRMKEVVKKFQKFHADFMNQYK